MTVLQLLIVGCSPISFQRPTLDPYVGLTAGASRLELDIESDDITLADSSDTAATIIAGGYSSFGGGRVGGELQLSDLGAATLNSGDQVGYQTASAALLGSLFPRRSGFNAYLKAGIGALRNDSPSNPSIDLVTDNTVNFVTGIGAEYLFNSGFGVRLEYTGHDQDVQFGTLGVTYNFGSRQRQQSRQPIVRRDVPTEQPVVVVRAPETTPPATDVRVPEPEVTDIPVVQDLPVITPLPEVRPTVAEVPVPAPVDNPVVDTDASALEVEVLDGNEDINVEPVETEAQTAAPISQPDITPLPEVSTRESVEELPVVEAPVQVEEIADDSDAIVISDIDGDGVSDQDDFCDDTRDGIPVNSSGCDRYNGLLPDAVFAPGEASLNARIRTVLDRVVDDLERFPDLNLQVQLLAESVADQDTFLARRRTIEILRFFRARGISSARLKTLVPTSASSGAGDSETSIVFLRTAQAE